MQFRISPSRNVSARSFGDEVVAANFITGIYYSMLGPAAQIWEGLVAGVPRDRVISEVAAFSSCDASEFTAAARAFVNSLVAEQLIVSSDGLQASAWTAAAPATSLYGLPALERFDDMADLLLLDPVHDVEDMGWPHAEAAE